MELFESFVNSERCKTMPTAFATRGSLRALLIRKDVKLYHAIIFTEQGLRALLIRKDVKQKVIQCVMAQV